jgi:ABC-type polysaccharide transport system permease subunit
MDEILERLESPQVNWNTMRLRGIMLKNPLPIGSDIVINNITHKVCAKESVTLKYYPSNQSLQMAVGFVLVSSKNRISLVMDKLGFETTQQFMQVYFYNVLTGSGPIEKVVTFHSFDGCNLVV